MDGKERQKKEIETIKERNIILNLSDADCEKMYNLCGMHNITVPKLLENFIGDLVRGTYTNGSDERMYANLYFRRCWFGRYSEKTLIEFLLYRGYDVYDDFLEVINDIENGYAELEDYRKDPSVFNEEEIEFLKIDITEWEKRLQKLSQTISNIIKKLIGVKKLKRLMSGGK